MKKLLLLLIPVAFLAGCRGTAETEEPAPRPAERTERCKSGM